MKTPASPMPIEMNWADYCDSLRNPEALPYGQSRKPFRVSPPLSARPPVVASDRQAGIREAATGA